MKDTPKGLRGTSSPRWFDIYGDPDSPHNLSGADKEAILKAFEAVKPKLIGTSDFGKVMIFGTGGDHSDSYRAYHDAVKKEVFIPKPRRMGITIEEDESGPFPQYFTTPFINRMNQVWLENRDAIHERHKDFFKNPIARASATDIMEGNEKEQLANKKPLTLGERRVRTEFNPGNDDKVQNLKEHFARSINRVEKLKKADVRSEDLGERARCIAEAQNLIETAAMWAVKAATFPKS